MLRGIVTVLVEGFNSLSRRPTMVVEPAVELPPVRGDHPCGVPDCFEATTVVEQDDRLTLVECSVHEARTLWDTTPIERREQEVIRVQDQWRQHGSRNSPR